MELLIKKTCTFRQWNSVTTLRDEKVFGMGQNICIKKEKISHNFIERSLYIFSEMYNIYDAKPKWRKRVLIYKMIISISSI